MYSKTSIRFTIEDFIAETEMRCPYCSKGELNIANGEKLYLIEGYRTYARMHERLVSENGFSFVKTMAPYVPWRTRKRLKRRVDAETFREPIRQHRMCQRCHAKLCRFLSTRYSISTLESGQREFIVEPFSMTYPCSMYNRTYRCRCCPATIPGGTHYLRVGHYDTICAACADILEGFIGTEFSY